MSRGSENAVESKKVGSEDIIVVQLPTDRFLGQIPSHFNPLLDEQGRHCVMLLAQDCNRCSFGDGEAGPTQELHLWLQVGSSIDDLRIEGADLMLPSQQWLALFVATTNPEVEANLRSFGFDPIRLAGVDHQLGGGSVELQDGARIEWIIAGPGRGPAKVGVHHVMYMPDDGPNAEGHRVAAFITDAMMGQPGELGVHTSALEPFLLPGERLSAVVHRMPKLEADVVWRRRSKTL